MMPFLSIKNTDTKPQTNSNIDASNHLRKTVITTNLKVVTSAQQVCNIEIPEVSEENKQQDNITSENQIQEVINSCHPDKRNMLNDIYETIFADCLKKSIAIEETLLDIFSALSKKYINSNAESISNKLRAVFKKLPDDIKIENTSFLKNICSNEAGYINSLLKLKGRTEDEMIETIKEAFKAKYVVEEHDLVIDLTDSQDIESDYTTGATREIYANNKRHLDDDGNLLTYKKFKKT